MLFSESYLQHALPSSIIKDKNKLANKQTKRRASKQAEIIRCGIMCKSNDDQCPVASGEWQLMPGGGGEEKWPAKCGSLVCRMGWVAWWVGGLVCATKCVTTWISFGEKLYRKLCERCWHLASGSRHRGWRRLQSCLQLPPASSS